MEMSMRAITARTAPLTWLCILLSTFDTATAALIRRTDHGKPMPSHLQSHWHTENLPPSKMTPEEAMAYYFPTLKEDCPNPPPKPSHQLHPGHGGADGDDGGVPEPIPGNWSVRNFNTVQAIYNLTVYPKNLPLFLNQTDIGLPFFNENVTGRVTPLGNFRGYEDNIEYFWGLAPVPVAPSTAAISLAKITQFTSGCPEVAASTVELTVSNVVGPNNNTFITKLKEIAFWRFDATGRIIAYDAWIPNLSQFVAKVTYPAVKSWPGGDYQANATDQLVTQAQICGIQDSFCTGGNRQYANITDCMAQLAAKPYGDYDETWGDNTVCRRIHTLLVPIRPEHHCPHVGPTGGGKCIDVDYNEAYFADAELYGGEDMFRCPGDFSPPS